MTPMVGCTLGLALLTFLYCFYLRYKIRKLDDELDEVYGILTKDPVEAYKTKSSNRTMLD